MAVESIANGNWSGDAATCWDLGSRPGDSHDVIIKSGHNITITQPERCNSFKIESGGTLTVSSGSNQSITIDNKGDGSDGTTNGFAADIDGAIVNAAAGKFDLIIETPSAASIDLAPTSGNVDNLTINHASADITATVSMNITSNLTITLGKLQCNGATVEVGGKTTVGPNSGVADQATLQCDASAMFLGINKTDDYALEIKRGGTYNGGTGNHQSGAVKVTTDSNAEAKLDFTNANHTIKSEYTSEDRFFELTSGTVTHSNGTIILDSAVTSAIQWLGTAGDAGPYDLKLDDTGMTVKPRNTLTVLHDMTILAGTFNTQYDGSDKDLIVNGDLLLHPSASAGTDHPAILTCNSSDITVGGKLETKGTWSGSGYAPKSIFNGGTGTHSYQGINFLVGSDVTLSAGVTSITGAVNGAGAGTALRLEVQSGYNTYSNGSGTVKFTSPNDQRLYSTGQQANNWTQFHNLTLEKTSSTLQGLTSVGFHIKVGNDLLITSGILNGATTDGTNHDLTAGSLTIASGGTYSATSGTTTITNETSGGFAINNDGTFTHNKGTVKIDYDTSTNLDITGTGGVDLYNLIVDSDATVGYNTSVIENNLTKLGSGLMRPTGDSGRNLTVEGTLLLKAGSFGRGPNDTHTNTFGNIVVEGGELILTGGGGSGKTIVNGSFRNVGGTITSHQI